MSSRFLPAFINNATYVISDLLPAIIAERATFGEMLEFCQQYRRRGIARFLQTAETNLLQQDLQRSGSAFAAYLAREGGAGNVVSKAAPFFDAVASADTQAAVRISRLSALTPSLDYEYEDDFLYIRILMGRFFLGFDDVELSAMLKRYEELLDGSEDPKYTICESFLKARPEQFGEAFEQLITTRDEHYTAGVEAEEIIEEEWATEGKIFVEGIALVRLAVSAGVPVQKDYLFVPSLAVRAGSVGYASDSWKAL